MHSNKNSLTKKEQIENRKKLLYNEKNIFWKEKENFVNSWNYDDVCNKLWRKTSGS